MSSAPLAGELSTFPVGPYHYPIFTSGDLSSDRAILFIGGLTNGLGAVTFTKGLSAALGEVGWKLVQFHWSSAYGGYGTGSLDRDREEMELLVKHLREKGVKTLVLMGHSTGSQNVMHYLSNPIFSSPSSSSSSSSAPTPPPPTATSNSTDPPNPLAPPSAPPRPTPAELRVEGGIMQAPVSDREFFRVLEMTQYADALPEAERLVKEGKGGRMMSDEFCAKAGFGGVPLNINAYRVWSLAGVGGDDDYFSSDIPLLPTKPYTHSLSTSFGRLSAPALALYAEKDAPYQLARPEDLLPKWQEASKGLLEWEILKGASHDVSEVEAQGVLQQVVVGWLKRFD